MRLMLTLSCVAVVGCRAPDQGRSRPPGSTPPTPTSHPVADVPALVAKLVASPAFVCINSRFSEPALDASADVVGAVGEAQARLATPASVNPIDAAFIAPLKRRAFDSVRRIAASDPELLPRMTDLLDHGPAVAPRTILWAEYAVYAKNHARASELLATSGPYDHDHAREAGVLVALGRWQEAVALEAVDPALQTIDAMVSQSPYAQDASTVGRAVAHYRELLDRRGTTYNELSLVSTVRHLRQLGYGAEARPLRAILEREKQPGERMLFELAVETAALADVLAPELAARLGTLRDTDYHRQLSWRRDVITQPLSGLVTRLSTFEATGDDLWSALVRHIDGGLDPAVDASLLAACERTTP